VIKPNWIVKDTAQEVAETVRDSILQTAKLAIHKNGVFKIVLAGGTTPEQVYSLLATESCDWHNWHIYLGDERCLPVNDPERNSQIIYRTLLKKVDIPQQNIHLIPSELGAKQASIAYEATIEEAVPFDIVLLGMGEDGHTASLFPGHKHQADELVHAVYDAPKPPPERVSLSVKALSQNHTLLIMVTGSAKQDSVQKWRNGEDLPVARISSLAKTEVLLDKKAYS